MVQQRKRKCRHCCDLFIPDHRNRAKQQYCGQPACRKASKAAAQKKWLGKKENRDYFRNADNVRRVQRWRQENPDYVKKKTHPKEMLQDHLSADPLEKQEDKSSLAIPALQDHLSGYPTVLVGLLAHISGITLQDDIVGLLSKMQQLGRDLLTNPFADKGGQHEETPNPDHPPHGPSRSTEVQLDRSAPDP